MGKTYKSETKKRKANERHKNRNRRCLSKRSKGINISNKKPSKHRNIFEMSFLFNGDSIEELINSLDSKIKNKPIIRKNNSDFRIKFPSDVNDRNFRELFLRGINSAKLNFSKNNLKILKIILLLLNKVKGNNIIGDEFGLKSCPNNLQKVFRKDLIFTLLSNESKLSDLGKTGLDKIEAKFKQSIEYNLFINNSVYSNSFIYKENNNGLYSFNNFKNILFSPVVLQAYKEVIEELYGENKCIHEIKSIIKDFIKRHNVYFIKMNIEYYGMILYDGTILINQAYYGLAFTHRNAFIILFTLLNEIMQALSRLIRGNDNYLLNNAEFIKAKNNTFTKESGFYFENKLLLSALKEKKLTSCEAEYLLNSKNYDYKTVGDFQKAFIDFRNKNKKIIETLSSFAVGKGSNNDIFSINTGCYCTGQRFNNE